MRSDDLQRIGRALERAGEILADYTPGEIEHGMTLAGAGGIRSHLFHDPMGAKRHQIVHQVVAAGDGMKNIGNARRFLADSDTVEAEMGQLLRILLPVITCHVVAPQG